MRIRFVTGILMILTAAVSARAQGVAPPVDKGMEVQARGPIHEAFGEPNQPNPQPGAVIPKKPPEPIPEIPPDRKPAGENVQWIPGYWAWDQDRADFIWVSGVWRKIPPGRRWVPGYWAQADEGWQWVPGLWAAADQEELPYQPQPPPSVENGPSVPTPDDSSLYVPGNWMYQGSRYAWRPGYWDTPRAGWVWIPATYIWTPRGYVYVSGYWDYVLDNRGLLFAPVAFTQPLWNTPDWAYQPAYCVDLDNLLASLFVGPGCSYYYGDYYGAPYLNAGYYPWCNWGPRYYDPLFGYYRWQRRDPNWYGNLRSSYLARSNGTAARPPRTLAAQVRNTSNVQMVTPLSQINSGGLVSVSGSRSGLQGQAARQFRAAAQSRARFEASRGPAAPSGRAPGVAPASRGSATTMSQGQPGPAPRFHSSGASPALHAAPAHVPTYPAPSRAPAVTRSVPNHASAAPHAAPGPHYSAPARAPAAQHSAPVHQSAPAHHALPSRSAPAHQSAPAHHAAPSHSAPARHSAPAHHSAPSHSSGHRR